MNRSQLRACLKDVKNLHAEFWTIPSNAPDPSEQPSGSALKNRYRYVLPNAHSRVKLPPPSAAAAAASSSCSTDAANPSSGYINGNYIRVNKDPV